MTQQITCILGTLSSLFCPYDPSFFKSTSCFVAAHMSRVEVTFLSYFGTTSITHQTLAFIRSHTWSAQGPYIDSRTHNTPCMHVMVDGIQCFTWCVFEYVDLFSPSYSDGSSFMLVLSPLVLHNLCPSCAHGDILC